MTNHLFKSWDLLLNNQLLLDFLCLCLSVPAFFAPTTLNLSIKNDSV